jgi:hypothetical protein
MKYFKIIAITLLAALILSCNTSPSISKPPPSNTNESLGGLITISFYDLNCRNHAEILKILSDYRQYQLTYAFCQRPWHPAPCWINLVFNRSTIDGHDLIKILQNDVRVEYAGYGGPKLRLRWLFIKLNNSDEEEEFLRSYSKYRLRGSLPRTPGRLFTFDDTAIFAGDFVRLLLADTRVYHAQLYYRIVDGEVLVTLNQNIANDEEKLLVFFQDYYFIEFRVSSTYGWIFSGTFDYIIFHEFNVLRLLQDDDRVRHVIFNAYITGINLCWLIYDEY